MKKKLIVSMLAASMAASLLVGCGSTTTEAPAEETTETEEATEEEAEEAAEEETEEAAEETEETADASEEWVIDMDNMLAGSPFEGLEAKDAYSYELIVKAFSASFYTAVCQGADAAAEDLGVSVESLGPNTESDIADQVNMLNAAINNDLDGIGLAAADSGSVADSMKAAMEKGIPIVAFDSGVDNPPEGSLLATVATDSFAAGKVGGTEVYKAVADQIGDTPIRIGMVAQDNTSASNSQRGLGFCEAVIENAAADGYKVAVIGNDWFLQRVSDVGDENDCDIIVECRVPSVTTVEQCKTECAAVLNEADTVAIFGSNQTVTEGLVQANDTLGVLSNDPATGIIGTGFDAGAIIKGAVADGTLYGCVTQMPYAMGYYTICSLIAANNGDEVEDLAIPAYWYNADNMNDALIAPNLYE